MICEPTIKNPKGLRTVCNKLILKLTSKAGGIPYTISDIPARFSKEPTMVVGIDIFHDRKNERNSIVALVATVD